MRIIITGGRDRKARNAIEGEFDRLYDFDVWDGCSGRFTIIHGDCPTGVDHDAAKFADDHGFPAEPHPADWTKYGRAAGPRRNEEMAESGAELCFAFPSSTRSPGTWDMIRRAVAHGIKTIIIPEEKA
ncbi:MAG: SLOG family protein [Bifidobacterium mongoliense]|jgi:hypothetical protein|uniref:SLOG family protein n=1 Tax=Bifidobacterium mongoliense TaxID=518643 RepID=UPI002F360C01